MRILEVRDGFVKVEVSEHLSITSFILIDDADKKFVAQVMQEKRAADNFIVIAKLVYLYDGNLLPYDFTSPSTKASISILPFEAVSTSIKTVYPVRTGKFIEDGSEIVLDKSCFDKKTLVSIDSKENVNLFLSNLRKQFSKTSKTIFIDTLGILDGVKSYASQDFKLPLNSSSLEFLYEDCLYDATSESKNLIKDIFRELAQYSKTVPFLPFGALKTIVEDLVEKAHEFRLIVLKNKLSKFEKAGYFATDKAEVDSLDDLLSQHTVTFDLSKIDALFLNRYLETVYSEVEKKYPDAQIFVIASNNISKKNLKNILSNKKIASVFISHSRFKYINEIRSMFENYIVEPSFVNNEVFKQYSSILNSIPEKTYLIVGKGTNYIPLVSKLEEDFEIIESIPQTDKKDIVVDADNEPKVENSEIVIEEVEKDAETIAIEKKSEDLIERVSEDIRDSEENISLFGDVEEENEEEITTEEAESGDTEEQKPQFDEITEIASGSQEELAIEDRAAFEEYNFHTNADATTIVKVEDTEIADVIIEDDLLGNDNTDSTLEDIPSNIEDEAETQNEISDTNDNTLTEEPELSENIELDTDDNSEEIITVDEQTSQALSEIPDETEVIIEEQLADEFDTELSNNDVEHTTIVSDEQEIIDYVEQTEYQTETLDNTELTSDKINDDDDFGEIVELDESELTDDVIAVDISDEDITEVENLDKEIVEDVDKVFTTMKEDTITDSDLDFIDELNSNDIDDNSVLEEMAENSSFEPLEAPEELTEDALVEPIEELNENSLENNTDDEILQTKEASTPNVPIYDADIPQEDMVMSDSIDQGDMVFHAKYGNGIVEKMIKYGTKTLYSINFDNVGRRLLDPTLTEIKKL
ncbi:MAG: hypothetical protein MJ231_01370 [bacterium]|nr:hypothetical protein [bacterium]